MTTKGMKISKSTEGLTLIELLVSISVLAVLLALAAPSFTGYIDRTRFTSAVDALAAGLHLVRSESLRNNQLAVVHFKDGTSWCLGSKLTTTNDTCDCSNATCTLRTLNASNNSGISQLTMADQSGGAASSLYYFFDANRGLASTPSGVSSTTAVTLTARSSAGREARVTLTATGMVSICSTSGGGLTAVYPAC